MKSNSSKKLVLAIVASAGLVTACSSSKEDSEAIEDMSDEAVLASVQSKLAPVAGAFDEPTGVVDESSMPRIIESMHQSSSAGEAGALAPTPFGIPSSTIGTRARSASGLRPATRDDAMSCMAQSGSTLTFDMGCLSDGEMTGRMVMRTVAGPGGAFDEYVGLLRYEDVCIASGAAGDVCIDGSIYIEQTSSPQTITMLQELEIRSRDFEASVRAALRFSLEDDGFELAAFDGDASYVVRWSDDGIVVTGSNGRFECSYTDGGEHGTCTSDSGESWTW